MLLLIILLVLLGMSMTKRLNLKLYENEMKIMSSFSKENWTCTCVCVSCIIKYATSSAVGTKTNTHLSPATDSLFSNERIGLACRKVCISKFHFSLYNLYIVSIRDHSTYIGGEKINYR